MFGLGFIPFVLKGGIATCYNNAKLKENQMKLMQSTSKNVASKNQHFEEDKAFKRYVHSLYGSKYNPNNVVANVRDISYNISDVITVSYDYSSFYLLIKAYLETKGLTEKTIWSKIIGEDSKFCNTFISLPYDAICIAFPPSCYNNKKALSNVIRNLESFVSENTHRIFKGQTDCQILQ